MFPTAFGDKTAFDSSLARFHDYGSWSSRLAKLFHAFALTNVGSIRDIAMYSWLQKGRPALFEALNLVCDQIDADVRDGTSITTTRLVLEESSRSCIRRPTDHMKELRAKERDQHDGIGQELEALRSRVAEVDRLEEENRTLRHRLLQFRGDSDAPDLTPKAFQKQAAPGLQSTTLVASPAIPAVTGNTTSPRRSDHRSDAQKKYNRLEKKYNALNTNWRRLRSGYAKRREELDSWKQYAESLEARIISSKEDGERPRVPVECSDDPAEEFFIRPHRRSRASSHVSISTRPHDLAAALSFSSEPGPDTASRESSVPALTSCRGGGSETESGSGGLIGHTDADSRLLNVHDENTPELPSLPRPVGLPTVIKVKPEPSSDEPIVVQERQVKKRKSSHDPNELARRWVKSEDSDSDPVGASRVVALLHADSLDLDEVGTRLSTPRKNRLSISLLESKRTPIHRADVPVQPGPVDTPTAGHHLKSSALTPLNPNARAVGPMASKSVDRPSKRGLASGVESLAEDGNLYKRAVRKKTNNIMRDSASDQGRLDRLLNTPAQDTQPKVVRSAPRPRDTSRPDSPNFLGPERRELPFGKKIRPSGMDRASHVAGAIDQQEGKVAEGSKDAAAATMDRQGKPLLGQLRQKDPSKLRLDDFKVNRKANDGSDYAYSEVVRGKADRACLPGCTDMGCCGKQFRALAQAQQQNAGNRSPSEDMRLFEAYLGDSISRIWAMSAEEKEGLWLEAKTWQLSNELGKHRHRFARRPSPPGFWDPGFPSTQELQAEKAEAAKRESKLVHERYREAMRSGGRWVFRDE